MPVFSSDLPLARDAGLPGCLNLVMDLPHKLKTEVARHPGAGPVGLVVMDLNTRDLRTGERGIGEEASRRRRSSLAQKRFRCPVADLKATGTDPAVQTTASRDLAVDEGAHDDITAGQPFLLPAVDQRTALLEG